MGFEQPGGLMAAEVPFHEAPKQQEEVEVREYGLNKERWDQFDQLLNINEFPTIGLFQTRLGLAEEFPEDYQKYDKVRMDRLLGLLKNLDPKSEEFKEAVKTIASMLQ